MNERIKQLYQQAHEPQPPTRGTGTLTKDILWEQPNKFNPEKFAELMVKKFDDILMLEQLDCIGNMDKKSVLLLDKIRERMKTYFGVEE